MNSKERTEMLLAGLLTLEDALQRVCQLEGVLQAEGMERQAEATGMASKMLLAARESLNQATGWMDVVLDPAQCDIRKPEEGSGYLYAVFHPSGAERREKLIQLDRTAVEHAEETAGRLGRLMLEEWRKAETVEGEWCP